ncbi:hypothetical protein BJY17_000736 [Agromyces hippuratus]|uniref:Putative T7SS secretion signal domain-containing protein n=1 Tax=Agromyces hippuratus TaxID=286438 RepID=A0A852WPU2_9MICO|nr:hypothetical protein [Agromyces hippuratus]NYG19989.1 hypothetical protein [Agromyces hippuratus]
MIDAGPVTLDATLFLPGRPGDVRDAADSWRAQAIGLEAVAVEIRRVSLTDIWDGPAARTASRQIAEHADRWQTAADVYREGATALHTYAEDLEAAQRQAIRAADLFARADAETRRTASLYELVVDEARRTAAATGAPFVIPREPSDEHAEEMQRQAMRWLAEAREDLDTAAARCSAALADHSVTLEGLLRRLQGVALAALLVQEETLRRVVNDTASFGAALLQNPDLLLELLGGIGGMAGGGALVLGGLGWSVVPGGVIAGGGEAVVAGGVIATAGAGLTGTAMSGLDQQASGPSKVEIWEARGPDRGDGRFVDGTYSNGRDAYYDSKDAERRILDRVEAQLGVPVERRQVKAHVEGEEQDGRFYDGLVDNGDGTYTGLETKSGNAGYSGPQKRFDELVSPENPANAMLDGRSIKITRVIVEFE